MPDWDIALDLDSALSEWASDIVGDVEDGVRATAPVSNKTEGDHFVDSIEARSTGEGVDVESSIIGKFLVEGTPEHEIPSTPKPPGTALRFESGGEAYFRQQVHHPGTGPHDFLERAIDAIGPEITERLGDKIGRQWES
jgi:hypothetical protein